MESKVAVYDTHEKAVNAIKALQDNHFPLEHVSLLGKAEITEDNIHIKSLDLIKETPAIVGMGAGTVVGLLTGLGVLAIPGFGVLYGAGALIGAIAGLDLGIVAGGFISLLIFLGMKKDIAIKVDEHLKSGKFMVLIKGSLEEIEKAEHILHTEGTHLEMFE